MSSPASIPPLPDGVDPFISVVMPVRNEAAFIGRSLGSVLAQTYPSDRFEVLVIDGASTDGTADLVRELAASPDAPRVVLAHNEAMLQPAALNIGLARAGGELIVRVDGHCVVPPDYLRRCVEVSRASGAACVGGPIRTIGTSPVARAIAAAQASRFGVGGVAFRTSTEARSVDTLAFGAYRREVFDLVGTFDEELLATEDDELNLRVTRAGLDIWMDPSITSDYYARSDLRGLWRQYFRYGMFKVPVMAKHRTVASPRHLVPAAFVVAVVGSVVLAVLARRRWLAGVVLVPYLVVNGAASAATARASRVSPLMVMAATTIMHVAYGVGTVVGLGRFWRRFSGAVPSRSMTEPSPGRT